MKRLVIMLVVLGLLMAFPATAIAKKPPKPPGRDPIPGYACSDAAPVTADFAVVLDANNPDVCIDVDSSAGDWKFTITTGTEGRVRSLWMAVKDSQPGDFCYEPDFWRRDIPSPPHNIVTHWVPAAVVDACDEIMAPRGYTDSGDSLVFAAMMGGRGSVTISVDLP